MKKLKPVKLKSLLLIGALLVISACDKMEDNYQKYLDMNLVYSPRVSNLTAEVGLKQAVLRWENPPGEIAKRILVDFQDDSLRFETMVDSAILENLEIKGYRVSVYTIDEFDNYSVPARIQIFPNGEK